MRNLFKKSLACCLALALCLTAMVGLTVSAAEVAGTITVGEVTVEPGTAEAKVDITLSAAGLSEAILNVSTDAGTITAVTSDDVSATLATNGIKMALYTEGDSSVDSATATITVALADTQTEKEYTVNVSIATAASVDENLINAEPASGKISVKAAHVHVTGYTNNENGTHTTKCTADGCDGTFVAATSDCTYVDGVCSACGYVKPVTGPTVDANLKVAGASLGFADNSLKITFRMAASVVDSYPNMELVFVPEKYDLTTTNLIESPAEVVIDKSELTVAGKNRTYIYTDIQLYELGLNINYFLRATDANGKVFISEPVDMVPATSLKNLYAGSTTSEALKTLITDILVVGEKAADYFAKPDSDLANADSIIGDFDISKASEISADYVPNTVDSADVADADFGTGTSCTHRVAKSLAISKAPYINYRITDKSKVLDIDKISIRVTYQSLHLSGAPTTYDHTFTAADGSIARNGNFVTFKFDQVGYGDSSQNLTVEISYDGEVVHTNTYAMENYLNSKLSDATLGEITTALMKLGIGFRAVNPQ